MFNQKIIEYLKKIKSNHFQEINKNPLVIYPEIEELEPVFNLDNDYFQEYENRGPRSVSYGEKFGSPNTRIALKWYKDHVSHEQFINSHYYGKVLERIPGQQTIIGDWHNHNTPAFRKSYIVSTIDPTEFLNIPSLRLPSLPRKRANDNLFFPIVNKLIKKRIVNDTSLFRPKPKQVIELDNSFVHRSAVLSLREDVSKELYRWFIYINY